MFLCVTIGEQMGRTAHPHTHTHQCVTPPTHTHQCVTPPTHTHQCVAPHTHTHQCVTPPTHTHQCVAPPTHTHQCVGHALACSAVMAASWLRASVCVGGVRGNMNTLSAPMTHVSRPPLSRESPCERCRLLLLGNASNRLCVCVCAALK